MYLGVLLVSVIVFLPFMFLAMPITPKFTLWIVRRWPALQKYWYMFGTFIFVSIVLLTAFYFSFVSSAPSSLASATDEFLGFLRYVFMGALPSVLIGLAVSL